MTGEPGTELDVVDAELVPSQPATLFGTDDPALVIERATAVATALSAVIERQQLYVGIGKKKHVLYEGWCLLGSMLGVFPVCTWTRKLDDGWEARVEAQTRDGAVVGAAEAECLRSEPRWKNADDYALRSMAQTRAGSKALRMPLGFVVTLGGYAATPAEEMPAEEKRVEGPGEAKPPKTWANVNAMVDAYGQREAWEALLRAASFHLYGETEGKKLEAEQRKDILHRAGAVCAWILNNPDTPLGSTWGVQQMLSGWASVLEGHVLETPELPETTPEYTE